MKIITPTAPPKKAGCKPVLLVDRDSFTRIIFSQYLRSKGYKVILAGSEEEALSATWKHRRLAWHAIITEVDLLEKMEKLGVKFKRRILIAPAQPARSARVGRRMTGSRPVRLLSKPVPPKMLIRALVRG